MEICILIFIALAYFTYVEQQNKIKAPQNDLTFDTKINFITKLYDLPKLQKKATVYRPKSFNDFIGQSSAKAKGRLAIERICKDIKTHIFLSAIQGHGKTTFARLFQLELDKFKKSELIEINGKTLTIEKIIEIVDYINSVNHYIVFFVDEIDACESKILKLMNPILEDFKYNGIEIKPFTFICATINAYKLHKESQDTLDRISAYISLDRYNADEICTILSNYQKNIYSNFTTKIENIKTLSANCKYTPRLGIDMLEDLVACGCIKSTLQANDVIANGLTKQDLKVLKVLSTATKMGANAIAQKIGMSEANYVCSIEPFLVEFGYINRVPMRQITEKGLNFLKEHLT